MELATQAKADVRKMVCVRLNRFVNTMQGHYPLEVRVAIIKWVQRFAIGI